MKAFLSRHKKLHIWLLTALSVIALFFIFRNSKYAMNFWVNYITTPIKKVCVSVNSIFFFSVAEVFIVLFALFLIASLIRSIIVLIRNDNKLRTLYTTVLGALSIALTVYAAFCLLWGANYYADSFQEKSSVYSSASTRDELYNTAKYFALKASETSKMVPRDENGLFNVSREEFFPQSLDIYSNLEEIYPELAIKDYVPKKLLTSSLLSYTNFTGFFFPFTGEANINTDCPDCIMPATIAHEMAHQRNIASENEANLVAILACTTSGNSTYEYSAYLVGYSYLANALYSEDYTLWQEVRSLLSEEAVTDLAYNNEYWSRHDTVVNQVSEDFYDSFLKSYGEESGIKTYGEVVDLLIAFYTDDGSISS